MEIEPESPLSVRPTRYENPRIKVVCVVIKVVICVVVEIQLEIEPESPLSVRPVHLLGNPSIKVVLEWRPARYEGIPGLG